MSITKKHLFIGLGGQGARTIASLRKVMKQRASNMDELEGLGVTFDFLSIDTSPAVWNSRKEWTHFGEDLQLKPNQMLQLSPPNLADAVDTFALDPSIGPWLGDKKILKEFVKGQVGIPGANQRRRFGRLLLASNASQVRKAIISKVDALVSGGDYSCWFHIIASVAGGTGSGCVIDVASMIRSQYPNASPDGGFPVYANLYATSDDGDLADVGFFYPNQYSTLRDINALMCGSLRPHLFDSASQGAKLSGGMPITAALISTNLNRRNQRLHLDTQVKIVAESTFERIYAYTTGNLSPVSQQSLTLEDIVPAAPGEPHPGIERAYRFATAGMRRWEVPNEKIEELLSLDLQSYSLRQLIFNTWQDGQGFASSAPAAAASTTSVVMERLDQLLREASYKGLLGAELKKQLGEEIDRLGNETKRGDATLEALEEAVVQNLQQSFGGNGIRNLFLQAEATRVQRVVDLCGTIDRELTRAWLSPVAPLGLAHLIEVFDSLELKIRAILESLASGAGVGTSMRNSLEARKREWNKITKFSRPFKADQLLDAHAANLRKDCLGHYESSCVNEDTAFLTLFLTDLDILRRKYKETRDDLNKWCKRVEDDSRQLLADLTDLGANDRANVYEIDHEGLSKFRSFLKLQEQQLRRVSVDIGKTIAADQTGSTIGVFTRKESTLRDDIEWKIEASSVTAARMLHQDFVHKGVAPRILGDSLLDRLQERGIVNVSSQITEFISQAASTCMIRDQGEIQPKLLDPQMPSDMPRRILVLGIPRNHPFASAIRASFGTAVPANSSFVSDIYEHDDPSQIRLLIVDYWMAARFASITHELRQKYVMAINAPGSPVAYFSNIDTAGEQDKRSDLLLPSPDEMRLKLESELWLGKLVSPPCITINGNGVFLTTIGNDGNVDERIGDTVQALAAQATIPVMFKVAGSVAQRLLLMEDSHRDGLRELVAKNEESVNVSHAPGSPERVRWQKLRLHLNRMLA
jgi:hypothetical protein